jgi:hypothetical protein
VTAILSRRGGKNKNYLEEKKFSVQERVPGIHDRWQTPFLDRRTLVTGKRSRSKHIGRKFRANRIKLLIEDPRNVGGFRFSGVFASRSG